MRKFGGVLVAAAMVLSVGAIAAPAGAATGPQCATLATKTVKTTVTVTLSKCTPTTATGGSGSGKFTASTAKSGTLNVTITWATKHGTTKGNVKFVTSSSKGKCASSATARVTVTGSITGGTAPALTTIKKGQKITASVCLGKTSDTLEPGTVFKF